MACWSVLTEIDKYQTELELISLLVMDIDRTFLRSTSSVFGLMVFIKQVTFR